MVEMVVGCNLAKSIGLEGKMKSRWRMQYKKGLDQMMQPTRSWFNPPRVSPKASEYNPVKSLSGYMYTNRYDTESRRSRGTEDKINSAN